MNWVETILLIIIVFGIFSTALREPALSFQYGKELVKSCTGVIKWCYKFVKQIKLSEPVKNNSTEVNTG